MPDTTARFKTQLPRNSFFQLLAFGTQVGIGIWLVPYLIRHLGTAAYGLIPVAGILTEYVSLISHSISTAVNRFLTIALQRDDLDEANRIFSTAFYSYLAIGLLQVPFFVLVIWYADSLITIPTELYKDAVVLLACSATVFLVNLVSGIFGVPIYANNRLDISRSIDIGRYLFRLAGIVIFFLTFGPALRYVGYVELTMSLVIFVAQVVIARRLAPTLRLGWHHYDWRKIKQLVGMGGWLLVNSIGTLLFLRIDVWVCNRFVGAESAGEYAAVLQWATLIRHGGIILSTLIAPMVMIYYARSQNGQLLRLCKLSVRVLSLCITVPIGIMCVSSPALLTIWLGEAFTGLAPLLILLVCHLAINVGVMPLFNIQVAMNKVRIPALVTFVMGVVNLVLAVSFVRYFHWGIYGVAIAGAIVLTTKNALFTPIYSAIILREPWHAFASSYLSALGLLVGLTASGYLLTRYMVPTSGFHLVLFSLGMGVTGLAGAWFLLPQPDRQELVSLIPGRFGTVAARLMPSD